MRPLKYSKPLAALTLLALVAGAPAASAATQNVSVRVEGTGGTLLEKRTVTIGDGTGTAKQYTSTGPTSTPLAAGCADDTAAQALEVATHLGLNPASAQYGWDRSTYIQTILGETHGYDPDSWTIYDGTNAAPHYADWGNCDLHLDAGDDLVLQAGENMSVANWRPYSPYVSDPVPATSRTAGTAFNVAVTKHVVPNTPDTPDSIPGHWLSPTPVASAAVGYVVTAKKIGSSPLVTATATTNSAGNASFTLPSGGQWTFKADATPLAITGNYARSAQSKQYCVNSSGVKTCSSRVASASQAAIRTR